MGNPFVAGTTTADATSTISNLPTFKEYAWDFEHDRFIFESGKHKIVEENEALKVWIYKTLKTERWRYRVYDNAYGIQLEQFIGAYTNNNSNAAEIDQYIREALLVNPYIKSIDDIKAEIDGDSLSYTIMLTTIYGTLTVSEKG
ncbi:DUF2634 domain-containing protein [Anaerosinus massiliensis]|uniref:DUF2634 domain-containing protein n=1 Tax=Massilibacillus massiliensis TaxID=1806837 RepID=UPI000ADE271B|nr:DUF2634 domain-containing protein [Massilibacillus massiliensis]